MGERTQQRLPRRALMATGALGALGALSLAGCSGDSEIEQQRKHLGTTPERVDATGVDLQDPASAVALESTDLTYRVTGTALLPDLTKEQADSLLGGNVTPEKGITPPEGSTFLVTTTAMGQLGEAAWSAAGHVEVHCRILVTDASGEQTTTTVNAYDVDEAWLLRVPADPAPEDALFEIEIAGKVQRLSLVDGTRVSSDLAYLDDRRRGVTLGTGRESDSAAAFEQESQDGDGGTDRLSFSVLADDAAIEPLVPAIGWPAEGNQLLGIRISPEQLYVPAGQDEAIPLPVRPHGCSLTAPDGTEVEQIGIESISPRIDEGSIRDEDWLVWFEVPVGLESAQVHLQVAPTPRRRDLAEALAAGTGAEVTVTLTEEPS